MAQRDVAAMDAGDVAGDGEPKPGRAGVLVARMVEPVERTEHLLALGLRECRDRRRRPRRTASHRWRSARDLDVVGEARGVVDEVGDGALEGMAPQRHDQRAHRSTSMRDVLAPWAWLFTSLRISPISARTISSPESPLAKAM